MEQFSFTFPKRVVNFKNPLSDNNYCKSYETTYLNVCVLVCFCLFSYTNFILSPYVSLCFSVSLCVSLCLSVSLCVSLCLSVSLCVSGSLSPCLSVSLSPCLSLFLYSLLESITNPKKDGQFSVAKTLYPKGNHSILKKLFSKIGKESWVLSQTPLNEKVI